MKAKSISRRKAASVSRRPKRRTARRAHGRRAAAAGAGEAVITPVLVEPDKRDDELSDEDAVDREERHALY